jgi:hypothetical protein
MCKNLLQWANTRISLHLITLCSPITYILSDTCEYGLGGYNIYSGRVWRFQLPIDCIGRAHINTLEFVASVISIWIEIHNNFINPYDCILSQMESTTKAGWLRKSNFSESISTDESSIRLINT